MTGVKGTHPKRRGEPMPVAGYLSLGSYERKNVGMIVTARELETATRLVLHEKGSPSDALRRICEQLDRLPGDWRVLCVSTPATIHRDLQGTRLMESEDALDIPERTALARIDRLDKLDPSLLPEETHRLDRRVDERRTRSRDTWLGIWRKDPDRDVRFRQDGKISDGRRNVHER